MPEELVIEMHGDRWWELALEGALSGEEVAAWELHLQECKACREDWEALLEVDQLFTAAPQPIPPVDFVGQTLLRLEAERRRQRRWRVVAGIVLVIVVLLVELVALHAIYHDVTRLVSTLLAAQTLIATTLMRLGVELITVAETLAPLMLLGAAACLLLMMPNGALATLAILMIRRR